MNKLIRISIQGQDDEATLEMMKVLERYLSEELFLKVSFSSENMRAFSVSVNAAEIKLLANKEAA